MKRSITFAVAAFAALALSGCGTDMYSQTAEQVAAVPGYSETLTTPNGSVGIRNAHLTYPGTEGYKAGSDATMKIWLFNDTPSAVTVVLRSEDGTVEPDRVVVPPAGMVSPEVTLAGLRRDIGTGGSARFKVEFVGHAVIEEATVPVAPPSQPAPRSAMPAPEGGSEGH